MGVKSGQFAERSEVPVSRTRAEIEDLLTARGAYQFVGGWDDERGVTFLAFNIRFGGRDDGQFRQVRMLLPIDRGEKEQRQRALWRSVLHVLKSRFIAIDAGISTFEREFLADVVLPDGRTLAEWAAPQIAAAYETNRMPELLPGAGVPRIEGARKADP